ncbi:MAG TPA: molybdate ABC transporter substrate-binding protein [Acetobacteraceae bacterium]|jgi:molybdate transport system substrate-binding protein
MPRRPALALLALPALFAACAGHPAALTVSVAASLQDGIAEAALGYSGTPIQFNFGASGALARQIVNGAPVDVFLSAAPGPMDELAAQGLIVRDTRRDLLRNRIVLIAAPDGVHSFDDLAGPRVKTVALGDPASVPAGDYGRQVLTALHLWDRVQPKLVLAKDVRQVLAYVATGNADAGIVYATDARESGRVRIAAAAPPGTHAPVIYPIAVVKASHNPAAARAFAAYLGGPAARTIFEAHGFTAATP